MIEVHPLPTNPRFQDITNKTYGQVKVVAFVGRYARQEDFAWKCLCACGREFVARGKDLKRGDTKSCGCTKSARISASKTTHGASCGYARTGEYMTWARILQRCRNPRNPNYPDYGGRGIKVCDRWKDFRNFLADMGRRPTDLHTIERQDNDGNYEPGNCRWATRLEQANNCRANHFLTYNGQTHTIAGWGRILGMRGAIISKRIKLGWAVEKTLTSPVRKLCIFRVKDS